MLLVVWGVLRSTLSSFFFKVVSVWFLLFLTVGLLFWAPPKTGSIERVVPGTIISSQTRFINSMRSSWVQDIRRACSEYLKSISSPERNWSWRPPSAPRRWISLKPSFKQCRTALSASLVSCSGICKNFVFGICWRVLMSSESKSPTTASLAELN